MNSIPPKLKVRPVLNFQNKSNTKVVDNLKAMMRQGGTYLDGKLTIELMASAPYARWYFQRFIPNPLEPDHRPANPDIDFGACEIEFGRRKFSGQVHSTGSHCIIGSVLGSVSAGTEHKLTHFTTHFQEFPIFQCCEMGAMLEVANKRLPPEEIEFKSGDLNVTLCSCRGVEGTNGFNGLMKVTSASEFNQRLVAPLLEQLHHFLSFAFGSWVSPAFTKGGNAAFDDFYSHFENYASVKTLDLRGWLACGHQCCLAEAFPGFVVQFGKADWKEPLTTAIGWLVGALTATRESKKKKMTYAQIPLEMFAWLVFCDLHEVVPEEEFRKLSAASKISMLLNNAKVPLEVPAKLTSLLKIQTKNSTLNNGPKLVVKLRNTIIHPSKKNRAFLDAIEADCDVDLEDVYREALELYQWYTTLIILHLIGYNGVYANRLGTPWNPTVEPVPWANQPGGAD